ncbi:hypothetical protein SO802_009468 [Lithocarpus litseifolius]|uniref:Uncharacterized protein n=1 Tax=Lithocarpus litseifolius TaxID=425828 RepID=A0AAW2DFU0_9ROSI
MVLKCRYGSIFCSAWSTSVNQGGCVQWTHRQEVSQQYRGLHDIGTMVIKSSLDIDLVYDSGHWGTSSTSRLLVELGHTAVNIGKSKVVVFGGLVDKKFLSDIVVYDITNFGFSQSALEVGLRTRYGGWDGKRWLSDVYVLDTKWMELSVSGSLPPPRCGHTATMVEKWLLVYGGRGEVAFCLLT